MESFAVKWYVFLNCTITVENEIIEKLLHLFL